MRLISALFREGKPLELNCRPVRAAYPGGQLMDNLRKALSFVGPWHRADTCGRFAGPSQRRPTRGNSALSGYLPLLLGTSGSGVGWNPLFLLCRKRQGKRLRGAHALPGRDPRPGGRRALRPRRKQKRKAAQPMGAGLPFPLADRWMGAGITPGYRCSRCGGC